MMLLTWKSAAEAGRECVEAIEGDTTTLQLDRTETRPEVHTDIGLRGCKD